MKKIASLLACLLFLANLAGCNKSSKKTGTTNKVKNSVNLVLADPQSSTIKLGGSQQLRVTVYTSGSSSKEVDYKVSDGSCVLKSGFTDLYLYTPAAVSGPHTVTFTSKEDPSKSGIATINVMEVKVNDISPQNPSIYTNGSQLFTASITGAEDDRGMWELAEGVGHIDQYGLYTSEVEGQAKVRYRSLADPTKFKETLIKVKDIFETAGFSWLKSYAPPGGQAWGKAVLVTSDNNIVLAADIKPQGSLETFAALVLYGNDGRKLTEWQNLTPSSIFAITYDKISDKIFVTGREGSNADPDKYKVLFLIASADNFSPIINKSFQVENKSSTGQDISAKNGRVGIAINSDYALNFEKYSGGEFKKFFTHDFVGIYDAQGETVHEWIPSQWEVASGCQGVVSSISYHSESLIAFSGQVFCNGVPVDNYFSQIKFLQGNSYSLDQWTGFGQGEYSKVRTPEEIIYSYANVIFARNKRYSPLKQDMSFSEYTEMTGNPSLIHGPTDWDGDNQGSVSFNTFKDFVLNPKEVGVVMVGSLSKLGGSNPGLTNGGVCYISRGDAIPTPPSIKWQRRFDVLPNGAVIESINGVVLDQDLYIIIAGNGGDKAMVGKSLDKLTIGF